jgi:hypothetical protein
MDPRRVLQGVLLAGLVVISTSVFASEIIELSRNGEVDRDDRGRFDRVLCVDGLKVFQSLSYGYGNGSGAAVSNIQLYEEKDGKVVPVRCSSEKKSAG